MIYGGFIWMLARGNEEHIKKAKEIIEAAILGLVIIFLAYTVTNFVLGRLLTGTGITPSSSTTTVTSEACWCDDEESDTVKVSAKST